mmetsp:Transcript_8566/g.15479  ORF Transcript_8566/g.15479 Transcript_8566/m.15479 type:complete len:268 (-) Transcript_8566:192-995(-)
MSGSSRLAATLEAFRKQQAAATKTTGQLAQERESKRAERKAAVPPKPKPAADRPAPVPKPAERTPAQRKAPLSKLLKDVLDCILAEDGRALSSDDIKAKCGIDIYSDSGLMAALQNHDRLELVNGFWSYKAKHKAQNKDELAKLMLRYPEGLRVLELKDSYKGVMEDLTTLKQDGRVYIIQNLDDPSQDVIFPCDPKLILTVDEDVVQLWNECQVDPDDMEAEMKKAGVKASVRKERQAIDLKGAKEKKRKKSKQRVFTNAHMVGKD